MKKVITVDQAEDSIRRLVARKGKDFVYQSPREDGACVYTHDGQPSCGIGIIMHEDYGVPISELEKWEELAISCVGIEGHEDAIAIFTGFQETQDEALPYGLCAVEAGVELR